MKPQELISLVSDNTLDATLTKLYGADALGEQKQRYIKAINNFSELYGADRDAFIFSVPGRSEIAGNHTDHNGGKEPRL